VTRRVDAIAVFPIDVVGVLPAVHEAEKAGLPVIGALGKIEGLPYVGVDDLEYGRVHARLMLEALKNIKGPKRIGLFRGTAGGSPDRLRMQECRRCSRRRERISLSRASPPTGRPKRR